MVKFMLFFYQIINKTLCLCVIDNTSIFIKKHKKALLQRYCCGNVVVFFTNVEFFTVWLYYCMRPEF